MCSLFHWKKSLEFQFNQDIQSDPPSLSVKHQSQRFLGYRFFSSLRPTSPARLFLTFFIPGTSTTPVSSLRSLVHQIFRIDFRFKSELSFSTLPEFLTVLEVYSLCLVLCIYIQVSVFFSFSILSIYLSHGTSFSVSSSLCSFLISSEKTRRQSFWVHHFLHAVPLL